MGKIYICLVMYTDTKVIMKFESIYDNVIGNKYGYNISLLLVIDSNYLNQKGLTGDLYILFG